MCDHEICHRSENERMNFLFVLCAFLFFRSFSIYWILGTLSRKQTHLFVIPFSLYVVCFRVVGVLLLFGFVIKSSEELGLFLYSCIVLRKFKYIYLFCFEKIQFFFLKKYSYFVNK